MSLSNERPKGRVKKRVSNIHRSGSRYLTATPELASDASLESSDDETIMEIRDNAYFDDSSGSGHLKGYDNAMTFLDTIMSELNQVIESSVEVRASMAPLPFVQVDPHEVEEEAVTPVNDVEPPHIDIKGPDSSKHSALSRDHSTGGHSNSRVSQKKLPPVRDPSVKHSAVLPLEPKHSSTGEPMLPPKKKMSRASMGRVFPAEERQSTSALQAVGDLADLQIDSKHKLGEFLTKDNVYGASDRHLGHPLTSDSARKMAHSSSSIASQGAHNVEELGAAAKRLQEKLLELPKMFATAMKPGEGGSEHALQERKKVQPKVKPKLLPLLRFFDPRLEKRFIRFVGKESNKNFIVMSSIFLVCLLAFILGDSFTLTNEVFDGPWFLPLWLVRVACLLPGMVMVVYGILCKKATKLLRYRSDLASVCLGLILLFSIVSFHLKCDSYVVKIRDNCTGQVNLSDVSSLISALRASSGRDGMVTADELFDFLLGGRKNELYQALALSTGANTGVAMLSLVENCALDSTVQFLKTERNMTLTMIVMMLATTFLFRLFFRHTLFILLPGTTLLWIADVILRSRLPNPSSLIVDALFFGAPLLLSGACVLLAQFTFERTERSEFFVNRVFEHSKLRFIREKAFREREAVERKQKFFHSLSHELRTPVHGILGLVDILLSENLERETMAYVENIQQSAKGMLSIVNDILDMSKLETSAFRLVNKEFDLVPTVQNVVLSLYPAARNLRVELICRIEPSAYITVKGDSGRLVQIMNNLVSNAMKFTACGSVTLAVWSEKVETEQESVEEEKKSADERGHSSSNKSGEEGEQSLVMENVEPNDGSPGKRRSKRTIHLAVIDEGDGIKKSDQEKLFDRYYQAVRKTEKKNAPQSTGLGLSIVQELALLMGGKAVVRSSLGVGSTFECTAVVEFIRNDDLKVKRPFCPAECCGHANPDEHVRSILSQAGDKIPPPFRPDMGGQSKSLLVLSNSMKQVDAVALIARYLSLNMFSPILPHNHPQLGLLQCESNTMLVASAGTKGRRKSAVLNVAPALAVRYLHGIYPPVDGEVARKVMSFKKGTGGVDTEVNLLVGMKGNTDVRFRRVWEDSSSIEFRLRECSIVMVDITEAEECNGDVHPTVDLFDPTLWAVVRDRQIVLCCPPGCNVGEKWKQYYPQLIVVRKPLTVGRVADALKLALDDQATSNSTVRPLTIRVDELNDTSNAKEVATAPSRAMGIGAVNRALQAFNTPLSKKLKPLEDADGVGQVSLPPRSNLGDIGQFRILLADDDNTSRMLMAVMLTKACNCVVHSVEDGQEALTLAKRGSQVVGEENPTPFHIIFTDQNMPKMDGFSLTTELRTNGFTDVPIVGISAESDESAYELWSAAGLTAHIVKPFTQDQVNDLCKEHMKL
uniref:Uncharacterized protein n=1 Tax=Palpitomonas bilix TaxID=652834 RepID=A0A7S3G0A3_9EUKA|mmetsp:Transcript_11269/g.29760  ORF Transcript_11269/g.29760 Transcript_11269/m.29760 type:complete len:1394 (+) Transcript_11269:254-4435(+)